MIKKNNFIQQHNLNKKNKPLLLRLEDALSTTSSEERKDKIFDLAGRYCKKMNKFSQQEFYSNLTQKTLRIKYIKGELFINPEFLNNGYQIYNLLKNNIVLPQKATPNYKHIIDEILDTEYKIIKKYYNSNKNDSNK